MPRPHSMKCESCSMLLVKGSQEFGTNSQTRVFTMLFHHHIYSLSNERLNVMTEKEARNPEIKARKFLLLALAGAQLRRPAPARELCTSTWFRLARAYAESQGCPWLLLSAKYGLVSPTEVISPYQLDVTNMGVRIGQSNRGYLSLPARCHQHGGPAKIVLGRENWRRSAAKTAIFRTINLGGWIEVL